jgi:hypothetical protein
MFKGILLQFFILIPMLSTHAEDQLEKCFQSLSQLPAVLPLKDDYAGEDKGQSRVFGATVVVYHFDTESRQKNRVHLADGLFVSPDGQLINTDHISVHTEPRLNDKALAVIDNNGILYISEKFKLDRMNYIFRHSSLVAGEDVYWAGLISIREGRLIFVDRSSGHYRPKIEHLLFFLETLQSSGVDLTDTAVGMDFRSQNLVGALEFISKTGRNRYRAGSDQALPLK